MINRLISSTIPLLPKSIAGRMAKRYIAGDNGNDAIQKSLGLKELGFTSTIDLLGEDLTSMDQAAVIIREYLGLMKQIEKSHVARNVSIKLSHIGLRINKERTFANLTKLLEPAMQKDFFIRIDMEDSSVTDATIDIYRQARKIWPRTGTVLQSRLKRTRDDALKLAGPDSNLRLCKGIYLEPDDIAYQSDEDIRTSYLEVFRILMEGGSYVGIATHDVALIQVIESIIQKDSIPSDRIEFQVLLGVPVNRELERLRKKGYKVRIYIPYGKDWYAYSMRRLKENPRIIGMVLKNLFSSDQIPNT